MQKPLAQDQITAFKKIMSPSVLELLQFFRGQFLVRVGETENVEAPEKNDFRVQILKNAEEAFRQTLKSLTIGEEVFFI